MRQLFPDSSRERRREGKGEELRKALCIVSSSECNKWWQLFFFSLFCFPFGETEQGEEPERRARIWKAGAAFKEKLKRTKKEGA